MFDMNKIKLGVSGLTNTIYLYRMGKNPNFALDKREAESEVFGCVIEYLLNGMLDKTTARACQSMRYGDKCFRVTVERINREAFEADKAPQGGCDDNV